MGWKINDVIVLNHVDIMRDGNGSDFGDRGRPGLSDGVGRLPPGVGADFGGC
jgi:hypothetical protein